MSLITSVSGAPLATVFLTYVFVVAALMSVVMLRYLPVGRAAVSIGMIALWLCYAGVIGYSGIIGDPARRPPGIVFLVAPILTFAVIVIGRASVGRNLAASLPLSMICALQSFRIGVELTLSALHNAGLTTRLLTLPGGNIEILVALSAPLIGLMAMCGVLARRVALAWNIIGLLSLLNVATRAVLTAPGPLNLIHAEVPNVAMGMFPFSYIPGFMAPLAMMLHVLAFRALRAGNTEKSATVNQTGFAI